MPTRNGKSTRQERKEHNRALWNAMRVVRDVKGIDKSPAKLVWERMSEENLRRLFMSDKDDMESLPAHMRDKLAAARKQFLHEAIECGLSRVAIAPIHPWPAVAGVYFVRVHDRVKIGISKSVRHRLTGIQTASPFTIELIAVQEGGRSEELALHKRFEDHHVLGEWFRLDNEILEYVAALRGLCPTSDYDLGDACAVVFDERQ